MSSITDENQEDKINDCDLKALQTFRDVPMNKVENIQMDEKLFEQLPDRMSLKTCHLNLDINSVEGWAIKCSSDDDYIYCVPQIDVIFQRTKKKIHRYELSSDFDRIEVKSWRAYHPELAKSVANVCSFKFAGHEFKVPFSLNGDDLKISVYSSNPDAIKNSLISSESEKGIMITYQMILT